MSDRLLSARLFGPVTGRPRRPLSIRASTASCSMRFSLRTMMSGAPSSSRRLRRLLRLMTRRYRSFRSLVAKRPPSSCTIGRISGGMTGTTSMIIHSGRLCDRRKDSTTSSRLMMRRRFWPEASRSSAVSSLESWSRSSSASSSLMDSAPMPARKSSSYFSRMSRYSASVRICFFISGVSPGSITI